MNKIIKSELLKWKGSFALNLILVLAIIQLFTIPLYLHFTNNLVLIENIIFFTYARLLYISINSLYITL